MNMHSYNCFCFCFFQALNADHRLSNLDCSLTCFILQQCSRSYNLVMYYNQNRVFLKSDCEFKAWMNMIEGLDPLWNANRYFSSYILIRANFNSDIIDTKASFPPANQVSGHTKCTRTTHKPSTNQKASN